MLLLVNEARDRVVGRLFGVSREQSGLVALFALGMIAQAAHDKAELLLRGPGGPSRSDLALGAGVLKELLTGIGGTIVPGHTTPWFSAGDRCAGSAAPSCAERYGARRERFVTPNPDRVESPVWSPDRPVVPPPGRAQFRSEQAMSVCSSGSRPVPRRKKTGPR